MCIRDSLYRDLKAEIMKEKNGEVIDNKVLSRLANLVLKHDNPDHPEQGTYRPRYSHLTIERDPVSYTHLDVAEQSYRTCRFFIYNRRHFQFGNFDDVIFPSFH